MGAVGSRAWTRYCELLVEKPILSKGLTGGVLFAGGDLLAQKLDGTLEGPKGYDPKRTVRGFFWSAVCFTPVGHAWYMGVLNRYLPGAATSEVLKKVALDQLLFGPIVNGVRLMSWFIVIFCIILWMSLNTLKFMYTARQSPFPLFYNSSLHLLCSHSPSWHIPRFHKAVTSMQ